jgi:uncharacterized protein (TIGR00251 family)
MRRKPDPGAQVEVRVTPRSTRNKVELTAEGRIHVWTTAPPTDGQANAAVCEAVAKALGIPRTRVEIMRGGTSRNKVVLVEGLSLEEVRSKLRREH